MAVLTRRNDPSFACLISPIPFTHFTHIPHRCTPWRCWATVPHFTPKLCPFHPYSPQVHSVEMLGGGVRMPRVKKTLEEYFKPAKLEVCP